MKHFRSERRKAEAHPAFPLTDSEGHEVKFDRRSGKGRRKNKQGTDIADKILGIVN